ncbi:parvalbumin, thymic CPV3-like isoform X2 [Carcharodon carcharias]|uniref:parvalbumin, thymic CPV3-like isoform X2 n=1 Tax=Carcharodon carcharias TaxID=13397 RepID=UPI001B7F1678|nr:parvalbumin, thymic CPV3-like isoform X2 [Carcharodon carcharias]
MLPIGEWWNSELQQQRDVRLEFTMKITDFLAAGDVAAALAECNDPGSFQPKKFSKTSGLAKKSAEEIKKIFAILDDDRSGFIEKSELKLFLQCFCPEARILSDSETDSFVLNGDVDGDGRIDFSEFQNLLTK